MLWLLACTPEAPPEAFVPPDAPGPFSAITWDASTPATSGETLTLQVWAPSSAPYGTEGVEYDDLLAGAAWSQGRIACDSPRPIVMFTHGHTGARWQSFFLTEALAEHGAVVVAMDHPYNTLADMDGDKTASVALNRPVDVADSYDWLLEESRDASSRLFGCVDQDAGYLALGHSFGGWTTVALAGARFDAAGMREHCAEEDSLLCGAEELVSADVVDLSDPRVETIVSMTPAGAVAFGPYLSEADVPALVLGGSLDRSTPWETETLPMHEGLGGEGALATLVGAGHFSFTEICALPLPDFDGCTDEYLEISEAHRLTNVLVLAWFKRWRGFTEAEAWLPPDEDDVEWRDRP